jgi:hypothetical protein
MLFTNGVCTRAVTITGRGFGWNPRTIAVSIGEAYVTDISLPTGWTYPVPELMGQTLVALAPPGTGARGLKVSFVRCPAHASIYSEGHSYCVNERWCNVCDGEATLTHEYTAGNGIYQGRLLSRLLFCMPRWPCILRSARRVFWWDL